MAAAPTGERREMHKGWCGGGDRASGRWRVRSERTTSHSSDQAPARTPPYRRRLRRLPCNGSREKGVTLDLLPLIVQISVFKATFSFNGGGVGEWVPFTLFIF